MKTTSISEAKNRLSALLELVRRGETVVITNRGRPVARLEPIHSEASPLGDEARLQELERAGIIKRGKPGALRKVLQQRPLKAAPGVDVLAALLEERAEGR
jgi:prevent-host-death family protein